MKTRTVVILVIIVILLFCMFYTKGPYKFRQDTDRIVSIEILRHDPSYDLSKARVLATIDPSLHRDVIDELLDMPGGRVLLDPPRGFGTYFLRVTYQDGECELIGKYNNGYITPNGRLRETNYSFDKERFDEFLSGLLGRKVIG